MKKLYSLLLLLLWGISLTAQIIKDGNLLYGNEWIDFEKLYLKIKVAQDGLYRLSPEQLRAADVPIDQITPQQLQLFHMGELQPLYYSDQTAFSNGSFIVFYGEKNTNQLDKYLYENQEAFNPHYGLTTDTSIYYLTWTSASNANSPAYLQQENRIEGSEPQQRWHLKTETAVFTNSNVFLRYDAQNLVFSSEFDPGNGFGTNFRPNPVEWSISPFQETTINGQLELNAVAVGQPQNNLGLQFNETELFSQRIPARTQQRIKIEVPGALLQSDNRLSFTGIGGYANYYSMSFAALTYPRAFQLSREAYYEFQLTPGPVRVSEIENFDLTGGNILAFNLDERRFLEGVVEEEKIQLAWPQLQDTSRFILVNMLSGLKEVDNLEKYNFRDWTSNTASYLIISHPGLYQDQDGLNPVQEYVDYRSSAAGGNYDVALINIEELYDQFAYGVRNHPFSIKNFSLQATENWPKLQYIFIIGHGYNFFDIRRNLENKAQNHYVPTYGFRGSDNLLFTPFNKVTPLFAHGRLAADRPEQVRFYLDKVRKHERSFDEERTLENHAWRKRFLHIIGGKNSQEQESFKFYLNRMAAVARDNGMGATVQNVEKASNEAVLTTTSEQVITALNEGVAIKSYLGHGGVTNTDFGLDNPMLFDNTERYPLIFSLGCLTGYLFDQQNSLSEDFVLTPNRGGIAYIASGGYAYPYALERLSSAFYRYAGNDLYDAGIGDIMKAMRSDFEGATNLGITSLVEQMSFHGDPAAKLHKYKGPDYLIDLASLDIQPNIITTQTDSITVRFDIANIGFTQSDTFALQINRTFADGRRESLMDTIFMQGSRKKMVYTLAVGTENVEGENKIAIQLDINNTIRELPAGPAEQNNELRTPSGRRELSFFVQRSEVTLIAPQDYGMVSSDPELIVSTFGLREKERLFNFELDTTATFNSGRLVNYQVGSEVGLIKWRPRDIDFQPGQVYYWRVRETDPVTLENSPWQVFSFAYLPQQNSKGWNQSDFEQFDDNNTNNLETVGNRQTFRFSTTAFDVIGEAMSFSGANDALSRYLYNNRRVFRAPLGGRLGQRHIAIAVFDPINGQIATRRGSSLKNYGASAFGGANANAFVFAIDEPAERDSIAAFIEEGIPEDHYALLITFHRGGNDLGAENWAVDSTTFGRNLFQVLEAQGATQVRALAQNSSLPYAFAFRKNNTALSEALASNRNDVASITFSVPNLGSSGAMTSPLIGPARAWEALSWQPSAPSDDREEQKLQIWGWDASLQSKDTLFRDVSRSGIELSAIDANTYPYLQLQYQNLDTIAFDYEPLNYWRVAYEPFPDLVLTPGSAFNFYSDTLQQGDQLRLKATVANFHAGLQDSLPLKLTLQSENNQTREFLQLLAPIASDTLRSFEFLLDTKNLSGNQNLIVELNPEQTIQEQNYSNNLGLLDFTIVKDIENPILDVTFDGRRILDGELVSARPLINISLLDDNEFLPLSDSSSFRIWLEQPDGTQREISIASPDIQFFPATADGKNRARIELQPDLAQEGIYKIRIRAIDASGNVGGGTDYRKAFKVIPESSLSNILPYPNPFTTSCQFVYTLTGDKEPSDFKIQIMTVSGRIVKEITQAEFGPMRVGTHRSDYIWDGTDDYGDRLANGVYLYRVIARDDNQEALKRYETEADKYFKNDFGKIVILR